MPLNEALLQPIPGPNPSGENLRYSPLFEKIKEARREEANAPAGVWQRETKKADYAQVAKLAQEALATQSKDLQLAAWLTEALLKKQGFGGLLDGVTLCHGLVEEFWDSVYPPLEDGEAELRAAPLDWLGGRLDVLLKSVPLNKDGHDFLSYQESRKVGYEDQAKSAEQKKAREAMLKENKLAPEAFDKAFTETPKVFYLQAEKDLDGCLAGLGGLEKLCDEKFGSAAAPSFRTLKTAVEEVRHTVHMLLEKKRETEPDPVEVVAPEAAAVEAAEGAGQGPSASAPAASIVFSVASSSEPAERREVIASVATAAAFLRRLEPYSPAPYLMLRGLRWGELRAAAASSDPTKLEAPPTDLRQHIRRLALEQKWKDLLETAENAMALPCSRAWLDLQRSVIEACAGLGSEYDPIAKAIRSELKTLLRDLPELPSATLMDDTAAANAQTQTWLRQLLQEPTDGAAAPLGTPQTASLPVLDDQPAPGWQKKFVDSFVLAKEALRTGQADKALEIMNDEIARQKSGRGRFLRTLQLVEICAAAGKEAIAQPILDDLAAAVEAHKLDDWEDHELVARALATIMKLSKRVQGDAKEKQKLFERICRLNPVQALASG